MADDNILDRLKSYRTAGQPDAAVGPSAADAAQAEMLRIAQTRSKFGLQPSSSMFRDVIGRGVIGQGLAMGGGDEAEAYARSLVSGTPYESELAKVRGEIAVAKAERPNWMGGAELVGAVLPAAATYFIPGMQAAAPAATARTAGLVAQLARGAGTGVVVGGGTGGVEGFLKGEGGAGARLDKAAEGAMMGGLFGGAIGGALPLAKGALQAFNAPAEQVAATRLQNVLQREGTDIEAATQQYMARQATGAKPEIMADVYAGGPVFMESRRVANMPGEATALAQQTLSERAKTQGPRIQSAFEEMAGTDAKFYPVMKELETVRSTTAAPLYKEAYPQPARSAAIDDVLVRVEDSVFDEARKAARDEKLIFPNLVQRNVGGEAKIVGDYTIKEVDMVKRGLDSIIESGTDITGKLNESARRAFRQKQQLTKAADEAVPTYAAARSAWAGPSAVMDSMKKGQRIFNERAENSLSDIVSMGKSEKEGFLVGVLDSVQQRIDAVMAGTDTSRRFLSGLNKKQIEAAASAVAKDPIEAKVIANKLIDNIEREFRMAETKRGIKGVSATAALQAEQQSALQQAGTAGSILTQLAQGMSPTSMAARGVQGGLSRLATGVTGKRMEDVNQELAKYLYAKDPAALQAQTSLLMQALQQKGQQAMPSRREQLIPGLLGGSYGSR